MTEITILGLPKGKERARTVRNGNKTVSYTPTQTKEYEQLVQWCYKIAKGEWFGNKPIKATITAHFKISQSSSRKNREQKLQLAILPCVKPDVDNIAKIILDALNGIAYEDDKQVVSLTVDKIYGEEPKVKVVLEKIWKIVLWFITK